MIAGFLWFQGTFPQFWYYTSPGKEEYSARLFRSEVGRSFLKKKKKKKKKREKQQFDKSCLWNDRQKGDITSHSAGVYSYSLFLGVSEEEMTVSILKVR